MPRQPRVFKPNRVYHVFNRRTDRQLLFPSTIAYRDFLDLMEEGRDRYNMRICGYCVMDTHWHQSLWTREDDHGAIVGRYLRWLEACHAIRFRRRSDTRGHGHVYQDRYDCVAVEDDLHYLSLLRYIEANPVKAGIVDRAEQWPWSSFKERVSGRRRIITEGPVPLPANWSEIVNARLHDEEDVDGSRV